MFSSTSVRASAVKGYLLCREVKGERETRSTKGVWKITRVSDCTHLDYVVHEAILELAVGDLVVPRSGSCEAEGQSRFQAIKKPKIGQDSLLQNLFHSSLIQLNELFQFRQGYEEICDSLLESDSHIDSPIIISSPNAH